MPEDDAETFSIYLNIFYTGKVATTERMDEETPLFSTRDSTQMIKEEFHELFCVYVLAEKPQDAKSKNVAMSAIVERVSPEQISDLEIHLLVPPVRNTAELVYARTPQNSPARRFVAYCYAALDPARLLAQAGDMPEQMRENVAKILEVSWPVKLNDILQQKYLEEE